MAAAGVAAVRGADMLPASQPIYRGLERTGGRWLRLDTSGGSALFRAEPGLSLDHDRGAMRVRARDGREVVVSGIDDVVFDRVVEVVGAAANVPR